jgi:hypothetical protein
MSMQHPPSLTEQNEGSTETRMQMKEENVLEPFAEARAKFRGIVDALIVPSNVDMESFSGTEHELAYAMEELYANDGR